MWDLPCIKTYKTRLDSVKFDYHNYWAEKKPEWKWISSKKILHDASTQECTWCHNDDALTKTVNKNMDLETSLNSLWSGPDEFKI